jgi:hypothetical protein
MLVVIDISSSFRDECLEHLLLFCHAYLALNDQLVVICCSSDTAKLIYPGSVSSSKSPNQFKQFHDLDELLLDSIRQMTSTGSLPKLAKAVAIALTCPVC